MNRRQLKIQKTIMEKIKPSDCQVCFIHDNALLPFKNIWGAQYDEYNKIAIIFTKKWVLQLLKKLLAIIKSYTSYFMRYAIT